MVVVGNSGTLVVENFVLPQFLGISDPLGLRSIEFTTAGSGGFITYDNVTVLVPEPSTFLLVSLSLGLMTRFKPRAMQ